MRKLTVPHRSPQPVEQRLRQPQLNSRHEHIGAKRFEFAHTSAHEIRIVRIHVFQPADGHWLPGRSFNKTQTHTTLLKRMASVEVADLQPLREVLCLQQIAK
jgi:hypothetical protein